MDSMDRARKMAILGLFLDLVFGTYHLVLGALSGSWWLFTLGLYDLILSASTSGEKQPAKRLAQMVRSSTSAICFFIFFLLLFCASILPEFDKLCNSGFALDSVAEKRYTDFSF